MKIVLFSLLCLILIGMTSYSYAEYIVVNKNTKDLPEALAQVEIRDSNGDLIAYIETAQIIGFSPPELNRFLDIQNQTHKEFFIKDDQKYESQQWETNTETYHEKLAYSSSAPRDIYQNEFVTILQMRHDSYQTQPGDTMRIFWTMIRPVR